MRRVHLQSIRSAYIISSGNGAINGNGYKRREHTRWPRPPRRKANNLLTELPERDKYYAMALVDLRDAMYAASRAWQREVNEERSRRIVLRGGEPLLTDEGNITIDLLTNATPAIMDLVFIYTEIRGIYIERLYIKARAALECKSKAARINGLIRLFGLEIAKGEGPFPVYYPEIGEGLPAWIIPATFSKDKTGISSRVHDPEDANGVLEFIRDNWKAVLAAIKKREEAEVKKQARRSGKLITGLQPVNGFIEAFQGPLTHQLSRRHMRGTPNDDPKLFDHFVDDYGKGKIHAQGMTIFIDNYRETIMKLDENAVKLNDLAAAKAKQTNSAEVFFSTAEYMRICELKDPYRARQEMKTSKEGLYSLSHRLTTRIKGQKEPGTNDFRLYQEVADDGGTNIGLKYSDKAFEILKSYVQPFDMDPRAFKLKGLDYMLYRRLLEHKTVNARKTKEREDPTLKPEDKISIKTLLEGTRLPTKEQVLEQYGPKLSEKILQPFEKGMETLVNEGILREWYYIGVNDAKVDLPKNYRQFEGLNIRFKLDMEPNTEKLQEHREKQEQLFEEEKKRAERKAVRKVIEAKNPKAKKV